MLRSVLITLLCLASLVACGGCKMLALVQDTRQKYPAEFDKLPNSKTAVVVWTPPETLFNYPYARFELMSHVGDKLTSDLGAKLATQNQTIDIVDARDTEDFLQRYPEAQVDPRRVGKHFKVDYVIYVELLEFQIRDPQRPQFLQGRISASLTVHDLHSDPDQARSYELSPVTTLYPEDRPVPLTASNSMEVRDQTYRKFGEHVARKFYEHTREN